MHKLAHPEGEMATSRAAAKAGICMGLSVFSTCSLEEVIQQGNGNPYFMHMTILKDRNATLNTIRRAEGMLINPTHRIRGGGSRDRRSGEGMKKIQLTGSQHPVTRPFSSQ